ncbi:MAG: bifunctional DNA-binding transcriptional regulator/O6-methylguanine-DNA methyltransferase Ada [Acidobacteriota bacterium]
MKTSQPLDESVCWDAVLAKDAAQDGRFFFGVVTTGVFCRPSCAARRPLRKNVRFYETLDAAASDGLRPCRRCRPTESPSTATIESMRRLCDHIRMQSDSGVDLTLAALARRAGMSASHFQRTFHGVVGVTPRQFLEACRLDALKKGLRSGASVTEAIYDAGFGSSSRVYERVDTRLGMTPSDYRTGGEGLEISYATAATPLGLMMIAATDRGLCFVQFAASEAELLRELRREYPAAVLEAAAAGGSRQFKAWMNALRQHLDGKLGKLDLPVAMDGSPFRLEVWRYLQTIPSGEVRSYSEVAAALGRPSAVRAVASACAANRVAIAIPCHRVLRADGALGGYRWGMKRKRALLAIEGKAESPER